MPRHIVMMGVAGAGKTTVGEAVAESMQFNFFDGDDHHPASNIEKMSRSEPLTDEDRLPWLNKLSDIMQSATTPAVISCSALKANYRELLCAENAILFVYLSISKEEAHKRLVSRTHFFPEDLLQDQFEVLEEPSDDEVLMLDATLSVSQLTDAIKIEYEALT